MDAAIFPGQGSQKPGMAKDFYETHPISQRTFAEASEALSEDLATLCFTDDPRLHLTENTQPAILTAEIAMFNALQTVYGFTPRAFAGHSLGEYAALVAAGVIPLAEAVRLVRQRGRMMQTAVPVGDGAMLAVIGEDLRPDAIRAYLDGLQVDLANHNSPQQIVLSGMTADIDIAQTRLQGADARMRLRRLAVSAPFHSRLMAPIEEDFGAQLRASAARWNPQNVGQVTSNASGDFYPETDLDAVVDGLTRQISGTVRWVENMHALTRRSPQRIVEIGPKRPLRGFFRTINVDVTAITNLTSARRAFA